MTKHFEASMQQDIDVIRGKIAEMSRLAQEAARRGLEALLMRSRQIAYSIILRDQRIDELEKEIDRLCLEFLVRQQPVANPLRFAYVTIKINQELERIGDYSESIAKQVIKLSDLQFEILRDRYTEIAEISIAMLKDATRAFLEQDVALARQTMQVEDKVDQLRDALNKELFQLRVAEKIPMEAFTPLTTIARRYERISDQAKNICEEVLYLVTGEYAKHQWVDTYRILFVDEHNSCRSQMAEGIANSLNLPDLVFSSAGLDPQPVDSGTIQFLKEKSVDISRHHAKGIAQVPNVEHYQVVVALAKNAQQVFAAVPGKVVKLNWPLSDPSQVKGNPAELHAAYTRAYNFLCDHIQDLAHAILGDREKPTK